MNKAISGLYAVAPDLADTAVAVISALFAAPDVESAARKFCQLLRVKHDVTQ